MILTPSAVIAGIALVVYASLLVKAIARRPVYDPATFHQIVTRRMIDLMLIVALLVGLLYHNLVDTSDPALSGTVLAAIATIAAIVGLALLITPYNTER